MSRLIPVLAALALGSALSAASDLTLDGSNQWILHTPDDGRQDLFVGHWLGKSWDWPYTLKADGTLCARGVYSGGNVTMAPNAALYSGGRMHIHGEEYLYLLNKSGTIVSKAWGGNGNLGVEGTLYAGSLSAGGGRMNIAGDEMLYVLNKGGAVISKAWGGNGNLGIEGTLYTGNLSAGGGRMHIAGDELLYLLNKSGVIVSKAWGGNGNLTVEGSLRASYIQTGRMLVNANWWADAVFADGYQLLPLSEVKAYIAEHRHLPGVPSEAAVKADGVQVSDMFAVQMGKIEELTLHAISQQETIDTLRADNAALLKRLARIEAAVGLAPAQEE